MVVTIGYIVAILMNKIDLQIENSNSQTCKVMNVMYTITFTNIKEF